LSPDIESFASPSALMSALADRVAEDLQAALAHKAWTSLAVPGGTTPGPFLGNLSGRDLHWNKVDVTLTDERWVPLNHPHSNERLVRASLLSERAAAVNFLPLYSEACGPEQALARVAVALEILRPLDVCVLGMGTDGHTASLFPGSDRLDEALDPRCTASVLPMRTPDTPEPRITLTAPVLTAAAHTYLLIAGDDKQAVLRRALEAGPATEMPVRVVLCGPGPVNVYQVPRAARPGGSHDPQSHRRIGHRARHGA